MYCTNCGQDNAAEANFCESCGSPMSAQTDDDSDVIESPFIRKHIAEIAKDAYWVYKSNFPQILAISVVAEVVFVLLGLAIDRLLISRLEREFATLSEIGGSPEQFFDVFIEQLPAIIVFAGLFILLTSIMTLLRHGALVHAVSEQYVLKPIRMIRPYTFAFKRLLAMIGASILVGIAVIAMSITIIGIPFAIYFGVRWSFIIPATLLEGYGARGALSRSSELVDENWWRVAGFGIGVGIIVAVAIGITAFVLSWIPYVGDFLASVLFTPVFIIAQTLLYFDLRLREDGAVKFNLETLTRELRMQDDSSQDYRYYGA